MGAHYELDITAPEDLEHRLREFERRYGVPSERFPDAFRDENGRLRESDDFHEWSSIYAAWRVATRQPA